MNGYQLALEQLSRLESFANVESNLADPPVFDRQRVESEIATATPTPAPIPAPRPAPNATSSGP